MRRWTTNSRKWSNGWKNIHLIYLKGNLLLYCSLYVHIGHKLQSRIFFFQKTLILGTWGKSLLTLTKPIRPLGRSTVNYAAPIFAPQLCNTNWRLQERVQNTLLCTITHYVTKWQMKTTYTNKRISCSSAHHHPNLVHTTIPATRQHKHFGNNEVPWKHWALFLFQNSAVCLCNYVPTDRQILNNFCKHLLHWTALSWCAL